MSDKGFVISDNFILSFKSPPYFIQLTEGDHDCQVKEQPNRYTSLCIIMAGVETI